MENRNSRSSSPFPSIHNQLLISSIAIFVVYLVLLTTFPPHVQTCEHSPYKRHANPDQLDRTFEALRNGLLFWGSRLVLLFLMGFALTRKKAEHSTPMIFFTFVTIFIVYFPGLYIIEHIKVTIPDYECGTKKAGNAVSGHTFFYVWILSSVYYFMKFIEETTEPISRTTTSGRIWEDWKFWIAGTISLVIVVPSAYATYAYGYHSLQQMFFGAIAGLLWNALLFWGIRELFDVKKPTNNISKRGSKGKLRTI